MSDNIGSTSWMEQLYEKKAGSVWYIEVEHSEGEDYVTGFSINKNNILAPGFGYGRKQVHKIRGRRLTETGFPNELSRVYSQPSWCLTLLKIDVGDENVDILDLATFGNATLEMGEEIFSISNFAMIEGWVIPGKVGHPCVDMEYLPAIRKPITCGSYEFIKPKMKEDRKMGDFYCQMWLEHLKKTGDVTFENQLHPFLPLIQCDNFPTRGSKNCGIGSPVFNAKIEVVGMICVSDSSHVLALHMSILRIFLRQAEIESRKNAKKK